MTLEQALLENYNLSPPLRVDSIRKGPDNEVFKITTGDQKRLILRLSHRQINDIGFEIEVLSQLHKLGVKVAPSIPTKNGQPYFLTKDKRIGAVFFFISGHHLEFGKDQKPDLKKVAVAAKTLADFHEKSRQLYVTNDRSRNIFTEFKRILANEKIFLASFENGREFLNYVNEYYDWGKSQTDDNIIIHNDYRPGNIFFNENKITAILDFDWSCPGPALKDLGLALVEWSFPDGAKEPWTDVFDVFYKNYIIKSVTKYPLDETLYRWISFSCLSDACTYFADTLDHEPPSRPQPVRSYMFSKFIYFNSKI